MSANISQSWFNCYILITNWEEFYALVFSKDTVLSVVLLEFLRLKEYSLIRRYKKKSLRKFSKIHQISNVYYLACKNIQVYLKEWLKFGILHSPLNKDDQISGLKRSIIS